MTVAMYWYIFKNTFTSQSIYRINTYFTILAGMLTLYIEISIWEAFYSGRQVVQTNNGAISLDDLVRYVFISMFLSMVIYNTMIGKINQRIRTGQIAMDLIRPVRLVNLLMTEILAENAYKLFFQFTPICVFGLFIFKGAFIVPDSIGIVVLASTNGFLLYFLLTYCLGLLSFWYTEIWQLAFLLDGLMKLLAGAWIPLWFFPEAFVKWIELFPFHLIFYVPISLYLNKFTPD